MNRFEEKRTVFPKASTALLALLVCSAVMSCMTQRDDRSYVQSNVVDKALFEGEWYHTHTVIDNDQESTYAWAFRGSVSFDQANSVIGTIARIRFVIDEDFLYAYRSYPLVDQSERTATGGRDMDIYEPMAAWPIEEHFDIVHRYNPETGETLNVVEENTQDRPWYERRFMRVDWAGNELIDGYNFNDIDVWDPLGIVTRQPASMFAQEGNAFPEQWHPRFDFTPTAGPEEGTWEEEYYDRYGPDRLYHFTFVTQEIWSPGMYPLLYSWARPYMLQGGDMHSSASLVSVRHSFLRVPDEEQYEAMDLPDELWERFGAWRLEQPTYIWGDLPDEENGLSNFYGQTDALNYYAGRHNIWRESFTVDEDGRRQPIPLADRDVQPVIYTLSERFPAWLIHTSFDLVGEWNGTLMETVRVARGEQLPEDLIPNSRCNTHDDCLVAHGEQYPYTTCRMSYDGQSRACTRHYSPFLEPVAALNDYRCHIVDANGELPLDPGTDLASFDDDRLAAQRGWRFVGDECVLVLRNNTCDDPVALAAATERRPECGNNPDLCCDQMGDLRFNFIAHNDQVGVMWGGVSQPLQDPITGELIQANANGAGLSIEGAMTYANWYFDLVDGEGDGADELSMMVGEDVRALMNASNYSIPPVTTTVPPLLGSTDGNPSSRLSGLLRRVEHSMERGAMLRGHEGHSKIHSRRLRSLGGTPFERSLLSGPDGMLSMGYAPETFDSEPSEEMLDHASPFREAGFASERERQALRHRMSIKCFYPSADETPEAFVDASFMEWLADMEGLSRQQRSIVVGRTYFRSMMIHEMGHSLGMRHNFEASTDFQNYQDPFYTIEDEIPVPRMGQYDDDNDGELSYEEMARFQADFRNAHDAREAAGIARHRSSSVMDYMPRTTNDLMPLGRYDRAFMHFIYGNQVQVYNQDPTELLVPETGQDRTWMQRPDRTTRSYETFFPAGHSCRIDRNTRTGTVIRHHHEDCPMGVVWHNPADHDLPACGPDSPCEPEIEGMRCDTARGWCMSEAFIVHSQCTYGEEQMGTCVESDETTFNGGCFAEEMEPTACDAGTECGGAGTVCVARGGETYCLERCNLVRQAVGQRCGENPRAGQSEHREDLPGVCLTYEDSWAEYQEEFRAGMEVMPVAYRFCSDERTTDISLCNRFDEGESFREIMTNYRDNWVRRYPLANFRRYRANWQGTSNFSMYADVAKILSHFYYRYFYEPGFRTEDRELWLGWIDHMAGAAQGLNFLAEVIAQPDVGSYSLDEDTGTYQLVASGELDQGQVNVPVGLGRYMWSSYQEGTHGILRMERQGSYNDKLYAMIALARREWGFAYSYDERFWINFYELFPYEMTQLFGGIMMDDPELYGARICPAGTLNPFDPEGGECAEDTVFYQDMWRGTCSFDDSECRGNPWEEAYASLPPIGGGSAEMLRTWAAILALAEFPVHFNSAFEQQMHLFIEGTGDSVEFTDCADDPSDPECLEEDIDFVRFFSDRYNMSFVSLHVEPQWDWEPDTVSPPFLMVQRANQLADDIYACQNDTEDCPVRASEADEAVTRWTEQLESMESFFLNIIDVQRQYEISSWF